MRFCSNCGNEIKGNQKYCNNCGQPVNARSAQYVVVEEKRSVWPWIIGIVGTLILLAGLTFAGLQIYKNIALNQASTQGNSDTALIDPDNQPTAQTSVDVLTDSFSVNFMKQENVGGYNGFNIGMTRDEVERMAGQSTGTLHMQKGTIIKYQNMGVQYGIDDKVTAVYVTPDNVTTQQFTSFHNDPDIGGASPMIYDSNKHNGFSIFVYIQDGYVVAVQNGPQI